ncbi:MAG TPA: DUF2721 domain-containing protein [Steroidobacteraceae bacterium]|nr:DUF2721 domain-containing protein [Steroidobacteraceae bacterium]
MDTQSGDVAHVIQMAVAPVFLLSGIAVTLGLFTNRLARIVDRARELEELQSRDGLNAVLRHGLRVLARRARYINRAIVLGTVSALLVALTVVLLFTHVLLGVHLSGAIAIVFVAAMLTLTAALLVFLVEVRVATAHLRIGSRLE